MYPSFLRTVPSDKRQVEAMVYLLNRFQWNWAAVVGSEDEYGRQGQRQFSTLAAKSSICVGYEGLIPMYRDPQPVVREILDRIAEAKVGVVVVFSLAQPARAFFTEVSEIASHIRVLKTDKIVKSHKLFKKLYAAIGLTVFKVH